MWLAAIVAILIALGIVAAAAAVSGPPQPAPFPNSIVYLYGPY